MATSKQILNRIKETIHNNELEFKEQVELFKYLGNDILQVKTKQEYCRIYNKSRMAYKWAKGTWIKIKGIPHEIVTDCK